MTTLVRVEIRRLLSRRLTRVLALLAIAGIVIAGVAIFFKSHRHATGPSVQAHVVERNGQKLVECSLGNLGVMTGELPEGTTPEEFCANSGFRAPDPRFHLTSLRDAWLGVGGQLIVVAWLLGASFVGADWHTGSITTQLTWEPRRTRIIVAKLLACVGVVFVATILLELLLGAALVPAAVFRGTTAGADGAWFADNLRLLLRAGAVCAFGSIIGFGLASIGRNTAAALGVGFVYLVVLEGFLRAWRPNWRAWLLGENVAQFLAGAREVVVPERSVVASGLVVAGYCAIAFAAGLTLFNRRDVT